MAAALVRLVALGTIMLLFMVSVPARAASDPHIIVHVYDQFGAWYDGVVVEIFQAPLVLVSNGTTSSGRFFSASLTASATYTVRVFSQADAASKTVALGGNDMDLNFTLVRPSPPYLTVVGVTLTPSITPGSTFVADLTIKDTSNSTAFASILTVLQASPFSLEGTGSLIPVGTISPGATKRVVATFAVAPTAPIGSYQVQYILNFTDALQSRFFTRGSFGVTVSGNPPRPMLFVSGVVFKPSIVSPGTVFAAQITVQNASNSTAYATTLNIQQTSPFAIVATGSALPLGSIGAGAKKTVTVSFSTPPTTRAGSYIIPYFFNFTDAAQNTLSSKGSFSITLAGTPVAPSLLITSVSSSPSSVPTGVPFLAIFLVSNMGSQWAYGALLTLNPSGLLSISGSSGVVSVGSIAPGGNKTVIVRMYSPLSTKSGSYNVNYAFTYYDNLGSPYNTAGQVNVLLLAQPNLKVLSLQFRTTPLTPGLDTFLNMGVINVGGDKAFDVQVLWSGHAPFLSNSTNYLGAISSGATGNSSFFVRIPAQTAATVYDLTLTINYKDASGALLTSVTDYQLPVVPYSPPKVSITNTLVDPPILSSGSQGTFTIFLRNDGQTTANNILVSVDDAPGILSSNSFGVGNLPPGAQTTSVVGVNVPGVSPGTYTLTITATYTDPAGVTYHSSIPVQLRIYSSFGLFSITGLEILLVVVLAAVLVFLVYLFLERKQITIHF